MQLILAGNNLYAPSLNVFLGFLILQRNKFQFMMHHCTVQCIGAAISSIYIRFLVWLTMSSLCCTSWSCEISCCCCICNCCIAWLVLLPPLLLLWIEFCYLNFLSILLDFLSQEKLKKIAEQLCKTSSFEW